LAEIEPRDVLLARLAGGFQAPLVKAAGLFQAFTRNFAYGVKAYVDQRVAGGEALEVAPSEEPTPEEPVAAADEAPTEAVDEAPVAEADEAPIEAAESESPPTESESNEENN
jgi:large subunit ribosomal protein L10